MDSTACLGLGVTLMFIAGIVFSITMSQAQSDGRFDPGADPTLGLLLTLAFALPGLTFFMIGVIAKGIAKANLESST